MYLSVSGVLLPGAYHEMQRNISFLSINLFNFAFGNNTEQVKSSLIQL